MNETDRDLINVQRAADDLRRGLPVIVHDVHEDEGVADEEKALLVMAAEHADTATLKLFDSLTDDSFIMLTNNRAMSLKVAGEDWPVVRINRPSWMTPADIVAMADPTLDLSSPLKGPFSRIHHPSEDVDRAAIKLAKFARLLPALVAAEIKGDPIDLFMEHDFSQAIVADVLSADLTQAATLKQVASARVPLAGAENTRLVSFRPLSGGVEHIAIVIGDPSRSEPVLMRIHSECFTGDLLASMKCDCGEQLQGAIKIVDEAGGGVILYLAQEGRGIGLVSKLKAYSLQDQGYDTVDANTRLGFDVDERVFAPAAEMLKGLGFNSVRLMTNNPNKVEGLERYGIKVSERVSHQFPPNPHNVQYLAVKKERTGHILD
jgi:GTP cyclohydrolase II